MAFGTEGFGCPAAGASSSLSTSTTESAAGFVRIFRVSAQGSCLAFLVIRGITTIAVVAAATTVVTEPAKWGPATIKSLKEVLGVELLG